MRLQNFQRNGLILIVNWIKKYMDAFDWKPRVFDGFLKMYFVRLAFLVRPLEYLLDLSGHINEVNFKKEINTLGSALKGLFNKKTKKYFNGTNRVAV